MEIQVRPAEVRDVAAISAVAREAWEYTYKDIYPPTYIQRFVRGAYGAEPLTRSIEADIARPIRLFFVAVNELDVPFAFAQAMPTDILGEYDLVRIYATPEAHQSGVGRTLLRALVSSDEAMTVLFAWVEKANRIGKQFYERNQFVCEDEQVNMVFDHETVLLKYVWKAYPSDKSAQEA